MTSFPDSEALAAFDPKAVVGVKFDRNEYTIDVPASNIVRICDFLRVDRGYVLLADLTCFDQYPIEPRFQVVYHLYRLKDHQFLRVKAAVPGDNPRIATVSGVWPAAGWHEREVFDLFGVIFEGHADLRRIVMPDTWLGHPLRKDYPTEGPR